MTEDNSLKDVLRAMRDIQRACRGKTIMVSLSGPDDSVATARIFTSTRSDAMSVLRALGITNWELGDELDMKYCGVDYVLDDATIRLYVLFYSNLSD